jgi:hypothetical protein
VADLFGILKVHGKGRSSMITKTRLMLYVENVTSSSHFWHQAFDARIVEKNELPDQAVNLVLAISKEVELSLFPKDFIKKYSPEVLDNTPSVMFFSTEFHALQQKLAALTKTGPITEVGGISTFNFADSEDHYFVVAKQ